MKFKKFFSLFQPSLQTRKYRRRHSNHSLPASLELLESRILLSATSTHQSDGHVENEIEHGIETEIEHGTGLEVEIEHGVEFSVPHNRDAATTSGFTTAQWAEVTEATSYRLEVYDVTIGQKVNEIKGIAGTEFDLTATLSPLKEFQVFVRAYNLDSKLNHWEQVTSFSNPTVPTDDPGAGDPANGGLSQLEWTASVDASRYDLEIYDIARGVKVLDVDDYFETSFTLPQTMESGTNYQAFVRDVDQFGDHDRWRSPVFFEYDSTGLTDPTTPPTPVDPSNGSLTQLEWTASVDASRYDLEIYDIARGVKVLDVDDYFATSFTLPQTLESGTNYQAFVRDVDQFGDHDRWRSPVFFEFDPTA